MALASDADLGAVQDALTRLVERHAALRTTFRLDDEQLTQLVNAPAAVPLQRMQSPVGWPGLASGHVAPPALRDFLALPFELARGPLLRAAVFHPASGPDVLLVVFHHIVVDGWSIARLTTELAELYSESRHAGRPRRAVDPAAESARPSLLDLGRDAALRNTGEEARRQVAYWRQRLHGASMGLPVSDRREAGSAAVRPVRVSNAVPVRVVSSVQELAADLGCPDSAVYRAAAHLSLGRACASTDVTLGLIHADRSDPESADLVGPQLDIIPLRMRHDERQSFQAWVSEVHGQYFDDLDHTGVGYDRIAAAVNADTRGQGGALVEAVFNDLRCLAEPSTTTLGDVLDLDYQLDSPFPLIIELAGGRSAVELQVTSQHPGLSSNWTEELAAEILRLLDEGSRNPSRPTAVLGRRSPPVKTRSGPPPASAGVTSLLARLDKVFKNQPGDIAIRDQDQQLTYRELEQRVARLAQLLLSHDVDRGEAVGVHMSRSSDWIVSMLAVLRAGGCYLPLDPRTPALRLRQMCRETDCRLVLTSTPVDSDAWSAETTLIQPGSSHRGSFETRALPERLDDDDLAYTIFTSGTTGLPKGVQVSHGALSRLVSWYVQVSTLASNDVVPQLASIGFDASILDTLPTLASGGCLLLVPDEVRVDPGLLTRLCERWQVTVAFLVTPVYQMLTAGERRLPSSLRRILVGGDRLHEAHAETGFDLLNLYGPTETAVVATCGQILAGTPVTIGSPRPGTDAYVLDEWLRPVSVGFPGELHIGGDNLARGYVRQPGLTARRFVPDPFSLEPGARMYATGDLVRQEPDGRLAFLGRRDRQVKLRGFRIDLGDIEHALASLAPVSAAVVLLIEEPARPERLAAFVTVSGAADAGQLRRGVAELLPEHMVPSSITVLPALPLTTAGKVDLAALSTLATQGLEVQGPAGSQPRRPEGPVAELVAAVWEQVLGVDGGSLSADSDFFAAGGHSLLAAQVASRLASRLGVAIAVSVLFEHRRLQQLADALEAQILQRIAQLQR